MSALPRARGCPDLEGHTQSSVVLTAAELAERWACTRGQVYRLVREGRIPHFMVGRYPRFRLDVIERYEEGAADG